MLGTATSEGAQRHDFEAQAFNYLRLPRVLDGTKFFSPRDYLLTHPPSRGVEHLIGQSRDVTCPTSAEIDAI